MHRHLLLLALIAIVAVGTVAAQERSADPREGKTAERERPAETEEPEEELKCEKDESVGWQTAVMLPTGEVTQGFICPRLDEDWYSFEGVAGQPVSIHVHANEIGSDVDPILDLHEMRTGRLYSIASSSDIRSEPDYATRIEGPNVDAAISCVGIPVAFLCATSRWSLGIQGSWAMTSSSPCSSIAS